MITLGLVEFLQRHDLRDDLARKIRLRGSFGFFSDFFLRGGMVEDDRAILSAHIIPLAVQCGGIVRFPERLDDFLVGSFRGVELDLDDFCVLGVTPTDVFVSGVFGFAARVAAGDGFDAGQHLEERFCAPEAAAADGGEFSRDSLHVRGFVRVSSVRGECADRQQTADELFHVDDLS